MNDSQGDSPTSALRERHYPFGDRTGAEIWPGGARMAVLIYVAVEEWHWDRKEPKGVAGARTIKEETVPSLTTRSAVKYGFQVGIHRLMDILEGHGVKITMWTSGKAADDHPTVVAEMAKRGHDVDAHSYSQGSSLVLMTRDEQRADIRETVEAIERVNGRRPQGWIGPGALANLDTVELLAEEGMLYHADLQDDELPYFIDIGERTLVEIPYRMTGNVNDFFVFGSEMRQPLGQALDYLKSAFDAYYREAGRRPLMFNYGMHPFVSGRPDCAYVFEQFLDYVMSYQDVWVPTYREVSEWWTKQYGGGYPAKR
jgi:peptidoglycan/xylan/chitin deacetylase (PgdA/CDA1 family)